MGLLPDDPEAQAGGGDGLSDDRVELGLEGLELDLVPQSCRKGGQRPLAIVAGAVEAPVYDPLDAASERLEERGDDKRRGRHGDGVSAGELRQDRLQPEDRTDEDDGQRGRHDGRSRPSG